MELSELRQVLPPEQPAFRAAQVYRAIAEKLPATTLVSIGHRATLSAFHKRRLEMQPQKDGPAEVREAAAEG